MLRTTFQKLTTLALIILGVSFLSCSPKLGTEMEYDFILTKSDLDHSKGTILIIQGAAPTNVDGRIPVDADIIYAKKSFNKNLADDLNKLGWDVVRYGKYGVYLNKIDWDKYRKTDLNFTLKQLRDVWQRVPSDKPLIVLALSEGTLHAGHLPLQDTKALILLGAIATNIKDVYLNKAKDDEELKKRTEKLESAHDMKRDEMFDKSWPAGRVVDQLALNPNWTYYDKYKDLPILILHGEADKEVDLSQTEIWKEKLPNNDITVTTKPDGNHLFGVGNTFDTKGLAKIVNEWLGEKQVVSNKS